MVLGNTFYKFLVKFMESFNVVGLWDFMSPLKGSVNNSINIKTNLFIETSETITERFSNSNIYASGVPTCFNYANYLKGSPGISYQISPLRHWIKLHRVKYDHVQRL